MSTIYSVLFLIGITYIISTVAKGLYAPGTYARYLWSTVECSLRYIAVFYYVTVPFVNPHPSSVVVFQYINVVLVPWIAYREYRSDDDNWWSGRGEKIKDWITASMLDLKVSPSGA